MQQQAWLRHSQRNHTISAASKNMMHLFRVSFLDKTYLPTTFAVGSRRLSIRCSLETGIGVWLSPFILSGHLHSHIDTFLKRFHSCVLMERSLKQMTWSVFLLLWQEQFLWKTTLENSEFSIAAPWLLCFPGKAFMGHELGQQHMTVQGKSKRQRLLSRSSLRGNYPESSERNPSTGSSSPAFAGVTKATHYLLGGLEKRVSPLQLMSHKEA